MKVLERIGKKIHGIEENFNLIAIKKIN